MKKMTSLEGITDPYVKRILGNILGRDPLKVLEASPRALRRAIRGLTKQQMQKHPAQGKWSIAQIISHLCDAELATGFRIRLAVAEPGSPLQSWDENRWAAALRYEQADPKLKLRLYEDLRNENLRLLHSLTNGEWQQFGLHQERGIESVERMAQLMAGHDVNHVKRVGEIRELLLKGKRG